MQETLFPDKQTESPKKVFKKISDTKYQFRAYIQKEQYYNRDSNYGVYRISTDDPIPHT